MNKETLYQILSGFFVGCLIISNILAAKTFVIGNIVLPCSIIFFPLVYIINDVMAECYGFERAKRVIYLGFGVNLLAVFAYEVAIHLPAYDPQIGAALEMVLSSTPRLFVASLSAYLLGSIANAKVMDIMRQGKGLFARCILSTVVGESIDALLFVVIAFIGTLPLHVIGTMILAQVVFM